MQQLVDNRYRIKKPLGSGGMADVYLAHDNVLDRDVALKVMSERYAKDEEFVERFRREAQSAAALSHPNIVSIYDRGSSEDGTYYIAMEYLPGGTLKDRILKKGALPPRTAAQVTLQIAEALRAAHNSGVVHRDIKPHNILITADGDLKVTDFGIARAATSSTMTKTGLILGTAHYISPEQAMGEPVGPASDLYSLGVVFYEMLTGQLPYDADTPIGIAMKHVNGSLRPPREVDPTIPGGINAIVVKLLSKDPKDRYQSASELIEDLEKVIEGGEPENATTQALGQVPPARTGDTIAYPSPAAREKASRERDKKRRRRGFLPAVVVLLLLALAALLAGAGYYLSGGNSQQGNNAPAMVSVPNMVGMKLDEAKSKYGGDFNIVVKDHVKGKDPKDTITKQDPSGGKAKKGSDIAVVVVGTQVADVPDVTGKSESDARNALTDAGFNVNVNKQHSSQVPQGSVISQSPNGGNSAQVGSTVTITVSSGVQMVKVPDIPYGYTAAQTQALLQKYGLKLGSQSSAYNSQIARGGVINQDPKPGVEVRPGSTVNITLSAGPKPVTVPGVIGEDISSAEQDLANAGLGYKLVQVQSNKPAGTVISENPSPGTQVDPGTYVTLTYSSGPPPAKTTPKSTPSSSNSHPSSGKGSSNSPPSSSKNSGAGQPPPGSGSGVKPGAGSGVIKKQGPADKLFQDIQKKVQGKGD